MYHKPSFLRRDNLKKIVIYDTEILYEENIFKIFGDLRRSQIISKKIGFFEVYNEL